MATALEKLERKAELLFKNTHDWNTNALKRIGRRIKEIGSLSHADLKALNSSAMVKQDINAIMAELAELTKQNAADVIKTYSEFLAEQHLENKPLYDYRNKPFIPFVENKELQAIVRAYAKTTMETMVKLSMTKAKAIGTVSKNGAFIPLEKSFISVIDRAVMAVATGTGDFGSEMRDTIRTLGGSGMRIDYGGGVTRRVESMVRQNLLWGAKRASKEYNEMIGEELGCDGIEVDWHSNPRPNHEFMQGKQFSLHGRKVIKGVVYEDAQDALSALEDYGCLHFKTPIILGVSEPRYSPQELAKLNAENKREIEIDSIKKTGYYWKQTMRHLEREARFAKEQIELFEASGDMTEAKNLRYKLTAISKRYNKVAEYSGITAQPGRMAYTKGLAKQLDISKKNDYNNIKRVSTEGLRNEVSLTTKQIEENIEYAISIGMPRNQIRYGENYYTSYGSEFDMLYIGTDVYPSLTNRKKANSRISNKGAIAHEIIGHRETILKGWAQEVDILDEIQASIRAARFAPKLTYEERFVLLRDAAERAKNNGITLKSVKEILHIKER